MRRGSRGGWRVGKSWIDVGGSPTIEPHAENILKKELNPIRMPPRKNHTTPASENDKQRIMAKTKPNTRASERAIRTPRADSHRERAAVLAPSDDTGIQKTTKKKKQLSSKQKQRRKERARRGAVFIEKLASKRDASVQKSRVVHERRVCLPPLGWMWGGANTGMDNL